MSRWLLALLVGAIVLFAGCQSGPVEGSLARVRASGKLRIGVDPNYPPFASLTSEGSPQGYEVELADEITRRLHVAPDLVGIDVGGIVDALLARKLDVIIAGLPSDPAAAKQLSFSHPYFNAGQVLVIRPGGPVQPDQLTGGAVGVESGTTGDLEVRRLAARNGEIQVVSYDTAEAALDDVLHNRLVAAVTDLVTAREYLSHNSGLLVAGQPLTDESYVVVARHADVSLISAISTILDDLKSEGYLTELEERWLR